MDSKMAWTNINKNRIYDFFNFENVFANASLEHWAKSFNLSFITFVPLFLYLGYLGRF